MRSHSLPAAPPRSDSVRAIGRMLGSCLFFGLMAVAVAAAHRRDPGLSSIVASLFRSGVNVLALLVLVRFDLRALWGDGRPALWARGLTGAVSLLTYFGALARIGVGEAAFLNQTSAFWVAALAPWLLRERTPARTWLAILGSLVGLSLMAPVGPAAWSGRLLGLASGLSASLAYLSVRRASDSNTPATIVAWFTGMGTLVSLGGTLLLGLPLPEDPVVLGLLVAAGLFATMGQLWMTQAYQLGPAAPVAAASAAGPLVATVLGALVLGQLPDPRAGAGMALLLVCAVALPLLGEAGRPRRREEG